MTGDQKQGFIDQLTTKQTVLEGSVASSRKDLEKIEKNRKLSKAKKEEQVAEKKDEIRSFETQIAELKVLIDTKKQEAAMRVADTGVQLDAKGANSDEQAKGVDLKNDLVNGILSEVELARKLEAEVLAQADRTTEGTVEGGSRPEDRAPESDVDFELPPDVVPPTPAQPKAATAPKAPATPPPTPVVSQAPAPAPATPAAAPASPDANQPTPENVDDFKIGDVVEMKDPTDVQYKGYKLEINGIPSNGKIVVKGERRDPVTGNHLAFSYDIDINLLKKVDNIPHGPENKPEALTLKIGDTVKLKDGGELYMGPRGVSVTEGKITNIEGLHVYIDGRDTKFFNGKLLEKVETTPPVNDQKLEDQKKEQIRLELEAIIAKVKSMDELKADPDFKVWMTKHGIKDSVVTTFIVDDALGADRRIEIVKSWQNPMFKVGLDLANQAPAERLDTMVEGKPIPPLDSAKKTPPGPEKKPTPEAESKIPVVAPKEQLLPTDKESLDWKAKARVAGAYSAEFMMWKPRGHAFLTVQAEKEIFSKKEFGTFAEGQKTINNFDQKCQALSKNAEAIEGKLRKARKNLTDKKTAEEAYKNKTLFKKVFSFGSAKLLVTTGSEGLEKDVAELTEQFKEVKKNLDNNYRALQEGTHKRTEKITQFVQSTIERFAPVEEELTEVKKDKEIVEESIRNLEMRNRELKNRLSIAKAEVRTSFVPDIAGEMATMQTNIIRNEQTIAQRRDELIDCETKIEDIKEQLKDKNERIVEFRRLEKAWNEEVKFRYGYFQGLRGEKFAPGSLGDTSETTGGTLGGDAGSHESAGNTDAEVEPTPEAEPVRNYKIDDLVKELNLLYKKDIEAVTVAIVEQELKKMQPDREKNKPVIFKDFMKVVDRLIDLRQEAFNRKPGKVGAPLNKKLILKNIQNIENSVKPIS